MRERHIRLGSISLLFTVLILCMAVLAVLSVSTAQADLAVAEQYMQHTTQAYAMEETAQIWLARTDAALSQRGAAVTQADLPDGTVLEDEVASILLEQDGMMADLAIRLTPEGEQRYEILRWKITARWTQDESVNLWQDEREER